MNIYNQLPDQEIVTKTISALKTNGMDALVVVTKEEAKAKITELIPKGSEIMTMSSVTLETIGITDEVQKSGRYISVKNKLSSFDRATQSREMQKIGSAPDWAIGSVQAVTEKGEVFIASNTGSQLPAYVYGSAHVIWVVGTQKIVKDTDMAMKRIYKYVLPLESKHMHDLYGVPGSNVSKLLIVNKEINPGRITVIFVNKVLGF